MLEEEVQEKIVEDEADYQNLESKSRSSTATFNDGAGSSKIGPKMVSQGLHSFMSALW